MSNQPFNGSKVPWVVFSTIIVIFVTAVGWIFSVSGGAEAKADMALGRVSAVEGDIKGINISLANILSAIQRIERKIDR
jgi:hypothetical protein